MKQFIGLLFLVGLAVVLSFSYWLKPKQNLISSTELTSGPFRFTYKFDGDPNLSAKIDTIKVSKSELILKSDFLKDLIEREMKLLFQSSETTLALHSAKTLSLSLPFSNPQLESLQKMQQEHPNVQLLFNENEQGITLFIDDQMKPLSELNLNFMEYSFLKTQQYYEKLRTIEKVVLRLILNSYARAKKLSVESYLHKYVTTRPIEITEKDINDFVKEKGIYLSKNNQELNRQIRNILVEKERSLLINNHVREQVKNKPIEINFKAPNYLPPLSSVKGIPSLPFNNTSAHDIYLFTNLNCENCRSMISKMNLLRGFFKDRIRINYFNSFSESDWRSHLVANASFCLNFQSPNYVWSFLTEMTQKSLPIDELKIDKTASEIGAQMDKFKSCMLSQKARKSIKDQLSYAQSIGVNQTPMVIVGQMVFNGSAPDENIFQAFGLLLQKDPREVKTGLSAIYTNLRNKLQSLFSAQSP